MVKADDAGAKLATDQIQRTSADMASNAAAAGIRGIGMINQIQQNTNNATGAAAADLSAKQASIDVAAAGASERIDDKLDSRNVAGQARTDQMLERGQALRSQGSAEIGAGAAVMGKAMDQGFKDVMSAKSGGQVSGDGGSNELSAGGAQGGGAAPAAAAPAESSGGGGGGAGKASGMMDKFGGGGMGGGGGGGMSWCDERLKENIKRIGTLDNGAGVYSFNYIGNDFTCIGPMAQELQVVNPEAVVEIDGYLAVNFNKI